MPALGEARVECQRTVDQPDHRTDVLAEIRQHKAGVDKDARVVLPRLERLPSEIAGLAAGCLQLFGPAVSDEVHMTDRRPRKRRPVMPIDSDRLLEQFQSIEGPLSCYWIKGSARTEVEVVGAEVGRRPGGGAAHLGH